LSSSQVCAKLQTRVENDTRNVNKQPQSQYDDGEELGDDNGLN